MKDDSPYLLDREDRAAQRPRYEIDGAHELTLPVLDCPSCGRWGAWGHAYPTLAPKDLPLALRRAAKEQRMSVDAWNSLCESTRSQLPSDVTLRPNAQFGALIGDMSGRVPDVAWMGYWTVLLRTSVHQLLKAEGFSLRGQIPKLKCRSPTADKLVELDIRPAVRLHGASAYQRCQICTRLGITAPDTIELSRDSYDRKLAIQRIQELPTYIVVSAAFKEAVERNKLSGSTFIPVKLR